MIKLIFVMKKLIRSFLPFVDPQVPDLEVNQFHHAWPR